MIGEKVFESAKKGWPRKWVPWTHAPRSYDAGDDWKEELKPVPWINGSGPEECQDWLAFPAERSFEAYYDRACVVCGEVMEGYVVFGNANDKKQTAGPGGHPRCMVLACTTCPNLMRAESEGRVIAYLYTGVGKGHMCLDREEPYNDGLQRIHCRATPLTLDELKAIAKRDPMGLMSRDTKTPAQ